MSGASPKRYSKKDLLACEEIINSPTQDAQAKYKAMARKAVYLYLGGEGFSKDPKASYDLLEALLKIQDLPKSVRANCLYYKARCLSSLEGVPNVRTDSAYKLELYDQAIADASSPEVKQLYPFLIKSAMLSKAELLFNLRRYNEASLVYRNLLEDDLTPFTAETIRELMSNVRDLARLRNPPDIDFFAKLMRSLRGCYPIFVERFTSPILYFYAPMSDFIDQVQKKYTKSKDPKHLNFFYQLAILDEDVFHSDPDARRSHRTWDEFFKAEPDFFLEMLLKDEKMNLATKCQYFMQLLKTSIDKKINIKPSVVLAVCNRLLDYVDEQRALARKPPVQGVSESKEAAILTEDAFIPYFNEIQNALDHVDQDDQALKERLALSACYPHIEHRDFWTTLMYLQGLKTNKNANAQLASLIFSLARESLTESFHGITNKCSLILLLLSRAEERASEVDNAILLHTFLMLKNNSHKVLSHLPIRECLGVDKVISFRLLVEVAETAVQAKQNAEEKNLQDSKKLIELLASVKQGFTPTIAAQLINHPLVQQQLKSTKEIGSSVVTTYEDLVVCPERYPLQQEKQKNSSLERSTAALLQMPARQLPERLSLVDTFWNESIAQLEEMRKNLLQKLKGILENLFKNHFKTKDGEQVKATFHSVLFASERDAAGKLLVNCRTIKNSSTLIDQIIEYINSASSSYDASGSFKSELIKAINTEFNLGIKIPATGNTSTIRQEFCNALASIKLDNPQIISSLGEVSEPSGFTKTSTNYVRLITAFQDCLSRVKDELDKGFPEQERDALLVTENDKDVLQTMFGIIASAQKKHDRFYDQAQPSVDGVRHTIHGCISDMREGCHLLRERLVKVDQHKKCFEAIANIMKELENFESTLPQKTPASYNRRAR